MRRLAGSFWDWLLWLGFHGNLSVFNSTWLGPVDENCSISPSGSGHSPSQDNACHHPHNRQYRSHAINRAETLHRTFGLSCQAMLCLRCYVSSRSPISAGVSGSYNHPAGAANAIKGNVKKKYLPAAGFFLAFQPAWSSMRLGAGSTQCLTYRLRLALVPECFKNPTHHRQNGSQGMERIARNTQAVYGFR